MPWCYFPLIITGSATLIKLLGNFIGLYTTKCKKYTNNSSKINLGSKQIK